MVLYNGRTYFWQWDTDQKILIGNDEVTEVHFVDKNKRVFVAEVYDTDDYKMCNVPDDVLKIAGDLNVYEYIVSNGDVGSYTFKSYVVPVYQREPPEQMLGVVDV